MEPIQIRHIMNIPNHVEHDRDSCERAADSALYVMFQIGAQFDQIFPPIFSNGKELWPLPPPYSAPTDEREAVVGARLDELLQNTKRNAQAFNAAVENNVKPEAQRIAEQMPTDSAQVWNDCNLLAKSIETESVYQTLALSEETQEVFDTTQVADEPEET